MPIIVGNVPAPMTWVRTPRPPCIWHHVIPQSRLRAVWNALVRAAQQTHAPEPTPAIKRHMQLCGMAPHYIETHINALRECALPIPVADQFRRFAMWPTWDIVEGPQNRADDPGADYLDRFSVGLTVPEQARMRAVEDYFHRIEPLPLVVPISMVTVRAIGEAAQLYRPMIVPPPVPIPFRNEVWEPAENGAWRKRRAH